MDIPPQQTDQPTPPTTAPSAAFPSTSSPSKLPWILAGVVLLVLGGIGGIFLGKQMATTSYVTPTPVAVLPTVAPDPTANWQTFADKDHVYSIKYPVNWYVYEFEGQQKCINISDIEKPTDIPKNISPEGHTVILICPGKSSMPLSWPYTNGSENNSTVKSFSINSYAGLRGEITSTLGLGEAVYLSNPAVSGAFIEFDKQLDDQHVFDQILSTFKFTDTDRTESILDIIKVKTVPMVWTDPQTGVEAYIKSDFEGPSSIKYPGVTIQSIFSRKENNRLSPLLATLSSDGSSGLSAYGWKYTGGGDGVGYSTNHFEMHSNNYWQFMNINLKGSVEGGEYKIFLSDPIK